MKRGFDSFGYSPFGKIIYGAIFMKNRIYTRAAALLLTLVIALTSLTSCAFLYDDNVNIVENETTDFSELSLIDQLFRQLSLFELDEEALDSVGAEVKKKYKYGKTYIHMVGRK